MSNSYTQKTTEHFTSSVAMAGGFTGIPDQPWIVGDGSNITHVASTSSSQIICWNGLRIPSISATTVSASAPTGGIVFEGTNNAIVFDDAGGTGFIQMPTGHITITNTLGYTNWTIGVGSSNLKLSPYNACILNYSSIQTIRNANSTGLPVNAAGTAAIDLQSSNVAAAGSIPTMVASGTEAMTIGGHNNTASGTNSTVLNGTNNTASGNNSVVMGGDTCTASHDFSVVWGQGGKSLSTYSYAVGATTTASRLSEMTRTLASVQTTNTTPTSIIGSSTIAFPSNTTSLIFIRLQGHSSSPEGHNAYYLYRVCLTNDSGTCSLEGSVTTVDSQVDGSYGTSPTVSVVSGGLSVSVVGISSTTINWTASCEITIAG